MKVLVQNYATTSTTEPLYISESINSVPGCECVLWGRNDVSAFDIFDIVKPDIFITHTNFLTSDIMKYLSSNKKITSVFNITGAKQADIDTIDSVMLENKVQCNLLFTNQPRKLNSLIQRKIKLISIMSGADVFLQKQNTVLPEYRVDLGIITNYSLPPESKLIDSCSTYHNLSGEPDLSSEVDINIDALFMHELYSRYKRVVITDDEMVIPQYFFDSILYGNETYYMPKAAAQVKQMDEIIQGFFSTNQSLVIGEEDVTSHSVDFSRIKKTLLSKHTCLSRVKRLFSRLKCSEVETEMERLIQEGVNSENS